MSQTQLLNQILEMIEKCPEMEIVSIDMRSREVVSRIREVGNREYDGLTEAEAICVLSEKMIDAIKSLRLRSGSNGDAFRLGLGDAKRIVESWRDKHRGEFEIVDGRLVKRTGPFA